jgi:hypothetical protein
MTTYVRVDISNVARGEWLSYIPFLDLTVTATTKDAVEMETYRIIEHSQGMHSFSVIWQDI